MMTATESVSCWCCTDCVMLFANGETPPELSEDETAAWLAEIDRRTDGYDVACGGEHEVGCENVEWDGDGSYVSWIGSSDCSCEDMEFSWRQCETCGSTLGGSRHAVTLFRR